ncbi:DUF2301 domain-containing membrane protein [Psychromonas ossibalaenae]|uniref:DUF2301 domain-containing membrane protein n=1 Tax=Psychromonas ossibalaenae TaxID=444922 RepID=UPI0003638805|nr:DUF2301 domain-containing membrane protein [Psychromonas ossibalaenae]
MADPHIQENLDRWDKLTISIYRFGMLLTFFALSGLALQQLFYPLWFKESLIFLALATLLQASSLHLYNKAIRLLLVNACWFGVWLSAVSFTLSGLLAAYLSLGLLSVTLAGIAFKESFCFSLASLKLVPVILVCTWGAVVASLGEWAAGGFFITALLYLYMAWKKINMPLYYDLGDRSKYEI